MLPIIDTHQHLWDLSIFRLPWTDGVPSLRRTFITSDYLEATKGLNVVKAIYMEVDVAPDQKDLEADYILNLCELPNNPTVGAVISGYPGTDGFRKYVRRFKGNSYIKGLRQVLHGGDTGPGFGLQTAYVKDIQHLGEMGLSFDLCLRPAELSDGIKLADLCPGTQFIVDHCGNADPYIVADPKPQSAGGDYAHTRQQWMDDIKALADRPNVVCKISGIIARAQPGWTPQTLAPTINHCLDSFGPDRVVFGGDWPVCTLGASYAEWVNALKAVIATRSEADQRKLLHDNTVRIYRLS